MVSETKNHGDSHGDGEMIMESETRQSPPQNQPHKTSRRQPTSIYSLTLDDVQHTLLGDDDSNKNFGSMNMDEFLNNIICSAAAEDHIDLPFLSLDNKSSSPSSCNSQTETKVLASSSTTQPNIGLPRRQGSFRLPPSLSQRTVEEVWSEICPANNRNNGANNAANNLGTTQRQSTFGEISLEDFLIKAGVVREPACGSSTVEHQLQYSNPTEPAVLAPQPCPLSQDLGGSFVGEGLPANYQDSNGGIPAYTTCPQGGVVVVGDMLRAGDGMGGYGAGQMLSSPAPPGEMGTSHQENKSVRQTQYELRMGRGGTRGRKRTSMDSPMEKMVVERRQRRMIKNREAASRSRARKQAYTVELEVALDQLKEENARLNQTLMQEMKASAAAASNKRPPLDQTEIMTYKRRTLTADKLKMLRRMWSSPSDLFTTFTKRCTYGTSFHAKCN